VSEKRHVNELRAGIFVAIGVVIFTAAIFLLGQKSALFTRNTVLFAQFRDISGLAVGAPVRLSGIEIGTVSAIALSQDVHEKKTRVRLLVQTRYLSRIRADSEALIDSAGLLGDKVVNISLGSPEARALKEGATLRTGEAVSFETLSSGLNHAVTSLTRIAGKVEGIVGSEQTAQVQTDVARIAASLAGIMEQVERGDGLLHHVVYDPRYARQVSAALNDVRIVAGNARRATGRIDGMLAQVERGDGTLHALLYGSEGKDALLSLRRAASEIADVVHAVRAEDGVLHALVYEPENKEFVTQLNQMSATLNRMVQDVDQGRGSLGGLLRDPTVYEDLKSVLGNVKRNVLFKALIRFTAESEHLRRSDSVPNVELEASPKIPEASTVPSSGTGKGP
jgi:phospholipid/cholesterol/gamma-HCH transport system substrate-binding protein